MAETNHQRLIAGWSAFALSAAWSTPTGWDLTPQSNAVFEGLLRRNPPERADAREVVSQSEPRMTRNGGFS
jgi:hypothetical protein